jgi:hypothetical protein
MVKRVLRRTPRIHQLVLVESGTMKARCGYKAPKPKAGLGNMAAFGHDCPSCKAETERMRTS